MRLPADGQLLRVFIGESDQWEGRPLYEQLVLLAKREGLAGATAVKGFLGFGGSSRIHTAKILRLSEDLPVIVEIVDTPEKIQAFMVYVDKMVGEGLVTLEKTNVVFYRAARGRMP